MGIEYSAKAIFVKDNHILLIRNIDEIGIWYCLPGGRQKYEETLYETLRRECLEEVGILVDSFKLLFVREYIHKNHKLHEKRRVNHKVELIFLCEGQIESLRSPTVS